MDAAIQEQLRQRYLTAMGVTSWLPVRSLPGAAASATWRWSELAPAGAGAQGSRAEARSPASAVASGPAAGTGSSAVAAATRQRPQAASAAIQQLLSTQPVAVPVAQPEPRTGVDSADPSATSAPPAAPATAVTEALPVPRFRLALVGYADCLVVNELPLQGLEGYTAGHQQLLSQILASIGLGQGDPQLQLFAWPVINSPHIDQGAAVARAGLGNLITRWQLPETVPALLLGRQAAEFVLPPEYGGSLDEPGRVADRPCLVAASLNEMMRVPSLKAELWRQLLQLRSLLAVAN